ncbi:MAG TPA: hypothetical protein VG273_11555 [Bryobacteraceae bacterium]|nr:hypothetical protein [Bryobacteraceae bacterium]
MDIAQLLCVERVMCCDEPNAFAGLPPFPLLIGRFLRARANLLNILVHRLNLETKSKTAQKISILRGRVSDVIFAFDVSSVFAAEINPRRQDPIQTPGREQPGFAFVFIGGSRRIWLVNIG